jgi:hypothetical protein
LKQHQKLLQGIQGISCLLLSFAKLKPLADGNLIAIAAAYGPDCAITTVVHFLFRLDLLLQPQLEPRPKPRHW